MVCSVYGLSGICLHANSIAGISFLPAETLSPYIGHLQTLSCLHRVKVSKRVLLNDQSDGTKIGHQK